MSKKNRLNIFLIACAILVSITILNALRVDGTNCIKINVPARVQIYSEGGMATNIMASPNDALFICGDKNDN